MLSRMVIVYFKSSFPLSVLSIRVRRDIILNVIIWPNLISAAHLTANIKNMGFEI